MIHNGIHTGIRTGIGGWTYPDWRGGTFYPDGLRQADELRYAADRLGAIEVNGTFYRLQNSRVFASWRDQVPDGFIFALKGSRYVGTRRNLAEAGEAVERFIGQGIAELGDALGPICWQLPKTKRFDREEIGGFLKLLPRELAGRPLRHAIEARHDSFDCDVFVDIARDAGVAIVYVEGGEGPCIEAATADFAYARYKNARADRKNGFGPKAIDGIAARMRGWSDKRGDIFCFVINGAKEKAPAAAMELARRLAG